jgi:hypothetical protein
MSFKISKIVFVDLFFLRINKKQFFFQIKPVGFLRHRFGLFLEIWPTKCLLSLQLFNTKSL